MNYRCFLHKIVSIIVVTMALGIGFALSASAAIDVVAATPELANIAEQVGGKKVSAYSIAKPNRDYHRVEPKPSDVSKVSRADLVVRVGLDLDMWMDALINAAGNKKVAKGGKGYVDASAGIKRLEVPKEQVTGASGDIHVNGNPHYFYDPENGKVIAKNIFEGLSRISPDDKDTFKKNYKDFVKELDSRIDRWQKELAPYKNDKVVTYHQSAIYFLRRFGLKSGGTIEAKPGIPPSASHVSDLIKQMKEQKITAMVIESVYPDRFPDLISRETGVKYQEVPYSVGGKGVKDYFDLIDAWVDKYKAALK